MIGSPIPSMPMSKAALAASGQPAELPQLPMMPPPGGAQMPASQASPASTGMTPQMQMPAPGSGPPFGTKIQADGSIAVVMKAADGSDVFTTIYPAPKIPKAFQQQPPAQPIQ